MPATSPSARSDLAESPAAAREAGAPALVVTQDDAQAAVASFTAIYRRWFHPVCQWIHAQGVRQGDLDDLAQEVFLVVDRRLPEFDGQNLAGWLYGITRKVVAGHRRRSWVRRWFGGGGDALDRVVAPGPDPHDLLEARRGVDDLQRALATMSEKRRTAFVLFEVYGYSGQEIAELLDVPLKTMWSRLHQARSEFLRTVEQAESARAIPSPEMGRAAKEVER